MTSHYEILGVAQHASESEIKRAWAKLVRLHPPDQDPDANRVLNEAKVVLLDPSARADYDAELLYGDDIKTLFQVAGEAIEEGAFTVAEVTLKEILAFHPRNLSARNLLGLVLSRQNRHAEAVAQLKKLVDIAPESALYAANLGGIYRKWGEKDSSKLRDAESWYVKATTLESFNSEHFESLASLCMDQERFSDAERYLELAIGADGKTDIGDIDTMMHLAFLMLLSNQKHRIQAVADRVSSVLPDDDEAHEYAAFKFLELAIMLVKEHDAYEASAIFTKAARSISYGFEKDALDVIESIERRATIEKEVVRMMKDESIQPTFVPKFFGFLTLKYLGEDLEETTLNTLLEAAGTWSQRELRSAASSCQRKYPVLMGAYTSEVENFVRLGYATSGVSNSSVSRAAQTHASTGSGCVIMLATFLSMLAMCGLAVALIIP